MAFDPDFREKPRGFWLREMLGIFLLFCMLLLLLSLLSFNPQDPSLNHALSNDEVANMGGLLGAYTAGFLNDLLGSGSLLLPLVLGGIGLGLLSRRLVLSWSRWLGVGLACLTVQVFLSSLDLHIGNLASGGVVGSLLLHASKSLLSPFGSGLLWAFLFFVGLQLVADLSWRGFVLRLGQLFSRQGNARSGQAAAAEPHSGQAAEGRNPRRERDFLFGDDDANGQEDDHQSGQRDVSADIVREMFGQDLFAELQDRDLAKERSKERAKERSKDLSADPDDSTPQDRDAPRAARLGAGADSQQDPDEEPLGILDKGALRVLDTLGRVPGAGFVKERAARLGSLLHRPGGAGGFSLGQQLRARAANLGEEDIPFARTDDSDVPFDRSYAAEYAPGDSRAGQGAGLGTGLGSAPRKVRVRTAKPKEKGSQPLLDLLFPFEKPVEQIPGQAAEQNSGLAASAEQPLSQPVDQAAVQPVVQPAAQPELSFDQVAAPVQVAEVVRERVAESPLEAAPIVEERVVPQAAPVRQSAVQDERGQARVREERVQAQPVPVAPARPVQAEDDERAFLLGGPDTTEAEDAMDLSAAVDSDFADDEIPAAQEPVRPQSRPQPQAAPVREPAPARAARAEEPVAAADHGAGQTAVQATAQVAGQMAGAVAGQAVGQAVQAAGRVAERAVERAGSGPVSLNLNLGTGQQAHAQPRPQARPQVAAPVAVPLSSQAAQPRQQMPAVQPVHSAMPAQDVVPQATPQAVRPGRAVPLQESGALHTFQGASVRPQDGQYELPPLELLQRPEDVDDEEKAREREEQINDYADALMSCLGDFGIQADLVRTTPGPVVTTYMLRPAPGVSVRAFTRHTDDIARSLMAVSVFIQAPVPGTDTVGIVIPNRDREVVNFRQIAENPLFLKSRAALPLIVGKDTTGKPYVDDLAKMPHLLVAGATGQGKSVCLNAMLTSLLLCKNPDELKLLLVDPKRVEMSIYEDEPHLIHPVVKEIEDAQNALKWAVQEMEIRYKRMSSIYTKNIASYNEKLASYGGRLPAELADHKPMPYIVIIIDELADLMLQARKEVEPCIIRLAQLARACGIHMVIATQRPSVDVVTGLIKANFPCRICFRVSSRQDSMTTLGTSGAEKLLGNGDMFFNPPNVGTSKRLHGPFLRDEEVGAVVNFWKAQAKPVYEVDFSTWGEEEEDTKRPGGRHEMDGEDALYQDIVDFCLDQGHVSISLLQRRFKLGYNKAARYMDKLDQDGLVGPSPGAGKPRPVLGR